MISSRPLRAVGLAALCAAAAAAFTAVIRSPGTATAESSGMTSRFIAARSVATMLNIGKVMGRLLEGQAPETVSLPHAEALANTTPHRAAIDRATDTIRFTGRTASLTIVADPPNGPAMRVSAGGLENPTIDVARGALVRIQFINGDSDSAHGWMLLDTIVKIGKVVHGPRAFPGAFALLGDPTSNGRPATTITFRPTRSGTYEYECPVPGHAAMGMRGTFIVTS